MIETIKKGDLEFVKLSKEEILKELNEISPHVHAQYLDIMQGLAIFAYDKDIKYLKLLGFVPQQEDGTFLSSTDRADANLIIKKSVEVMVDLERKHFALKQKEATNPTIN